MKKVFLLLAAIFVINIVNAQPPIITSFSPDSGSIGTLIKITGTNLNSPISFIVGEKTAIVISNSDTTLVGLIMPGTITGNISITTTNGTAISGNNFIISENTYPFVQQGSKLASNDSDTSNMGVSVSVSADGNTAIIGGSKDSNYIGAAWIFVRNENSWTQQGNKLVGADGLNVSGSGIRQGTSVALSADGNTAIVGGPWDNSQVGAAWIYTRNGNVWTQQGNKLIATDYINNSRQGTSVSLSADGNTAIIGGSGDNGYLGAAWVFTRNGGLWTQQGNKLVGSGYTGSYPIEQGCSVALSADGTTAVVGGSGDNNYVGASWIYTRNGGLWTQQGNKLVGTGYVQPTGYDVNQGSRVALNADGNTAIVGGPFDNKQLGAAWVFIRSGGVWTQQGNKLVGTGTIGNVLGVGGSVSLSADGNTAIVGVPDDNSQVGAVLIYKRNDGIWTQQSSKLIGTGAIYSSNQGSSVSLSTDGKTLVIGGPAVNINGAAWVFISDTPNNQASNIIFTNVSKSQMDIKCKKGNSTSRVIFVKQSNSGTASPINNTTYNANTTFGSMDTQIGNSGWYCVYNDTGSVVTVLGLTANTNYIAQVFEYSGSTDHETYLTITTTNNPNTITTPDEPTITSFSPNIGPVGTLVSIKGTYLNNPTTFLIGEQNAIIVSKTDTTIVGMVMPGANTGNVSITTLSGNVISGVNFTVEPTTYPSQQQGDKLVAASLDSVKNQSLSVALSADGNTAIVGAININDGKSAAIVYVRNVGIWTQQGNKLECSDADGSSQEGPSVSLSADGNTAIIGVRSDHSYIGASWIFVRYGEIWTQQGNKLVGSGYVPNSFQGSSVSLSADGNTAIIGGLGDNNYVGAVWIFTRKEGIWTQQGNKLVGTGANGNANQGQSVSLSSDGSTAIVGGYLDSSGVGAAWIFNRYGETWIQQGSKLVGIGHIGSSQQGWTTSLSADGNTAVLGAPQDSLLYGAAWIFIRNGGVWSQQGKKLIGTGATVNPSHGRVSICADGNTFILGGAKDNSGIGAAWLFTRNENVWTQQGSKLVGSGAIGSSYQNRVALSSDGNTAIVGGNGDNNYIGAAWIYNSTNTYSVRSYEANNDIIIYPNPTKDNLTIETNSNKEQRLEIINLIGQTVYTSSINNKKVTINTSAFANGVYILKLYTDKETVVRKFIKE